MERGKYVVKTVNREMSRKMKLAFTIVERTQRFVSLPIIGSLAVWAAGLTGHQRVIKLVRGTSMLRRIDAEFPFFCGKHVTIDFPEGLHMGKWVSLKDGVYINAKGGVNIGPYSYLDFSSSIHGQGGVTMGERCGLASGACIHSHSKARAQGEYLPILDTDFLAPVHIGNDVGIGANCVVLPGVTIGDHTGVGALSLINKDIPPWSLVIGIPARVIRNRHPSSPESQQGSI